MPRPADVPAVAQGGLLLSYVLPIRRNDSAPIDELVSYLGWLAGVVDEVVVVDGSPEHLYRELDHRLDERVRHLPPTGTALNGKVAGVHTGIEHSRHEHVVIADDDVRYDRASLDAVVTALGEADLVAPQNYFAPLPWHARWDTARTLLNRVLGGDFPGTLAVRRSTFDEAGGYDGDVLWENLELMRSIGSVGGTIARPLDLYVRRLPPTARHFFSQRVRQAYDELARPVHLATELAIVPAVVTCTARRRWTPLVAAAVASVVLAEVGRRRDGGGRVFPATSALWAPVWLLERGTCSWLALLSRVRIGGVRYAGQTITRATSRTPGRRTPLRRPDVVSTFATTGRSRAPLAGAGLSSDAEGGVGGGQVDVRSGARARSSRSATWRRASWSPSSSRSVS